MAKTEMLHIRLDPDIKERADKMFHALGLTTSEAIKIFLSAALRAGGLPFDVSAPEYSYKADSPAAKDNANSSKTAAGNSGAHNAETYDNFQDIIDEVDAELAEDEDDSSES